MSYSPSTLSDDNKPPPDPRYHEWDTRSRQELKDRLYEAVDKRREATEELIPRVINEQLHILGVNNDNNDNNESCKIYRVSDDNVMKLTHQAIDQQIQEWKGLRWWRFNEKNACDSWPKWFKKAKCWQDQNQHKPLGRFWCLIFDELKQYTSNVANNKFENNPRHKQALQNCLFAKCVEAVLKGAVRFERTRETPLLPVRALTQSKELQQKLNVIDNGFTLSIWKQHAEAEHKRQKQQHRNSNRNGSGNGEKGQRANVATILNERCGKHATKVYQRYVRSLSQIIPSLNIDMSAIQTAMELNHNPYSSNSDYHPVTSYNDNKKHIMNNSRSRYQYIPDNHSNHSNHSNHNNHNNVQSRATRPTPAVFASLPNNMDVNTNNSHTRNIPTHSRGYGPSRGISNNIQRAESHRYSPTLSSNSLSDTSSLSNDDAVSSVSVGTSHSSSMHSSYSATNTHRSSFRPTNTGNNPIPIKPPAPRTRIDNVSNMNMANMNINNVSSGHNTSNQLDRLSNENQALKQQLAEIRRQLRDRSHSSEQQTALNAIVQQMQVQNQWSQFMMAQNMKQFMTPPHIPSPMSVPVPPTMAMGPMPPPPPIPMRPSMIPPGLPSSIPFNDRNGGHGIYTPQDGKMFYFPSKDSMNGNSNNNKSKNKNKNKSKTRNLLDVDQIVNNGQMNMDITMSSSASLSDDSSTSNDNINNNNNNKNSNSSAQQPGIYGVNEYIIPDCFCDVRPPSDINDIYHSEGTPDITPQTSASSSSSCWDTESQFPSSFRDNNTFIGVGLAPCSSIPPPTYPPNHGYIHHPFDDLNSVYGDHPAHI